VIGRIKDKLHDKHPRARDAEFLAAADAAAHNAMLLDKLCSRYNKRSDVAPLAAPPSIKAETSTTAMAWFDSVVDAEVKEFGTDVTMLQAIASYIELVYFSPPLCASGQGSSIDALLLTRDSKKGTLEVKQTVEGKVSFKLWGKVRILDAPANAPKILHIGSVGDAQLYLDGTKHGNPMRSDCALGWALPLATSATHDVVYTTVTIEIGTVQGYGAELLVKIPTLEPTTEQLADTLPAKLTRAKTLAKPGEAEQAQPKPAPKEKAKPSKARFFTMH